MANLIRSNRTFFAVAMLCFLAMKGFGFLAMASAIGKNPDITPRSFALAVLGAHCDRDHESGAPQDAHAHHAECCFICSGKSRQNTLGDPGFLGMVVALLTPRLENPPTIVSFTRHGPLLKNSSGLFSDWSPTAPPVG